MTDAIDKARRTQAASIESLTGKTIDQLHGRMLQWTEVKHGELVARAREEFGLSYGHANFLVHSFRNANESAESATVERGADPSFSHSSNSRWPGGVML